MANRTLRRTTVRINKPSDGDGSEPDGVPVTIADDGSIAPGEQLNIADDDTESDGAERSVADGASGRVRSGVVEIDPGELQQFIADGDRGNGDGSDTGNGERKQRRPRGPNKRTKQAPQTIDVAAIKMLCNTLFVIAQQPELELDDSEAKKISDAYAEFSKYHDVPLVSPKRISEFNLAGALFTVFGTRAIVMFKRAKRPHLKPSQVVTINQPSEGTA